MPRAHDTFPNSHLAIDLWRSQEVTIMQILDAVDAASLRSDIPVFAPGDTVKAVSYTHLTLPTIA